MLSRRRQSRHLIYATLSPTSKGRSISSHHFYSQANISPTFSHSTPSIICSSPTRPQCSSYETLKELHAKLSETRQTLNNTCPPTKSINRHGVCERMELSTGLQDMMNDLESKSKLGYKSDHPRPEIALFDRSSESKRYPNGSTAVKKSEPRYPERSSSNLLFSENPPASIYQRSNTSSEDDTWDSAEVAWPTLGRVYQGSGSSVSELETFTELEVDQKKPIRAEVEPLLFAMSPLWSEPEWTEFPHDSADSDEESEDSDEGTLDEDESENEMLSNTLLAPIDIPGTKKSTRHASKPLSVNTFPVKLVSPSNVCCS